MAAASKTGKIPAVLKTCIAQAWRLDLGLSSKLTEKSTLAITHVVPPLPYAPEGGNGCALPACTVQLAFTFTK